MNNIDLSKLDPSQLIAAYIEARTGEAGIIDDVPTNATNAAIGSIEEILHYLNVEPYFDEKEN